MGHIHLRAWPGVRVTFQDGPRVWKEHAEPHGTHTPARRSEIPPPSPAESLRMTWPVKLASPRIMRERDCLGKRSAPQSRGAGFSNAVVH